MRTDRQKDLTELIAAFRNFANAPNEIKQVGKYINKAILN
jgi:hypothetical protein